MLRRLAQGQQIALQRFLWKIALPREFAINLVINTTIAFLVFRGRNNIGLLGWGGIASMLIPMSILLPFFTSFFGVFAGRIARLGNSELPPLDHQKPWIGFAVLTSLRNSIVVMCANAAVLYGLDYGMPGIEMVWAWVVLGIGVGSALFACFLHGVSIRESMRL